jgi:hypothetical protein
MIWHLADEDDSSEFGIQDTDYKSQDAASFFSMVLCRSNKSSNTWAKPQPGTTRQATGQATASHSKPQPTIALFAQGLNAG